MSTDLDYLSAIEAATTLDELRPLVLGCQRCPLRQGCKGVVFGEGVPDARLMLIGEGPGQREDDKGRPFVGAAGELLDRILAASGFSRRKNVYIGNVVKCRPPGNRIPTPEEREACLVNLRAQLRIIRPRIIVLLGATALQALVDPKARIRQARGRWIKGVHESFGLDEVDVMPTFHPAALLRDPKLKVPVWDDFKRVIDRYRALVDPGHESPHYPLQNQPAWTHRPPAHPL